MLLLWTMHLNTLKTGTNAFTMDCAFKHVAFTMAWVVYLINIVIT